MRSGKTLLLHWLPLIITVAIANNLSPYRQRNIVSVGEIDVNGEITKVSISSDQYVINVMDYGAKSNDSSFDNTAAFKKALDAADALGGTAVYVPAGHFYFQGQISVPSGCSLIGSYITLPLHSFPKDINDITDGTVLAPYYGKGMKGNDSADAFITMQQQSTLQGFVIFYPDQVCENKAPLIYPPTIYIGQADVTVNDIELLNSWVGIYAVKAGRYVISRIGGQPINIGIYVDEIYDIGRLENAQFKSNYCHEPLYWREQQFFGRSFVFGRIDWSYTFNTFSWGYAIGYHFIETSTGSPSGNFLGIGSDACNNVSIKIDSVKPWGLVITNGEFVAMRNKDLNSTSIPSVVQINENNKGSIQFTNSMFWGSNQYIAEINGNAQVSFSNCQFQTWDNIYKNNSAAIQVKKGVVKLIGNDFYLAKPQIYFKNGTQKGIAIGNTVNGKVDIKADNGVNVHIDGNL